MTIINDINAPQVLIDALSNDDYDYNPNTISVTTLIDSPYIAYLKSKHDKEAIGYASKMLAALDGSAMHYVLERAGSAYVTELRLTQEFMGVTISGKFDMWEPKTATLWDYKKTSVWTVIYNPEGKKEWEAQLNINKWLMEAHGIPVEELKILVFYKDWSKTDALSKNNYPQHAVEVLKFRIWNWEELSEYLTDRVSQHKEARKGNPRLCNDDERWMKKPVYAVQKIGAKRSSKNCDTRIEAEAWMVGKDDYEIIERQGEYTRCEHWCFFKPFCEHYKKTPLDDSPFMEGVPKINQTIFPSIDNLI